MSHVKSEIRVQDWGGAWSDFQAPCESLFRAHGMELVWRSDKSPPQPINRDLLTQADLHLFKGDTCTQLDPIVDRRPASGLQLPYFDLLDCLDSNGSWGYCLLRDIFLQGFTRLRQSRRLKGPVIFIGDSPQTPVFLETLFLCGFNQFSLLVSEANFASLQNLRKKLLGLQLERIESRDLIQSSVEHTLCLVLRRRYPEELLNDLSYFHFLSGNSVVLAMVDESNFPIAEVLALGNEVTGRSEIFASAQEVLLSRLEQIAIAHKLWIA